MTKLEIIKNKIIDIHQLAQKGNQWRIKSEKIVFTNGCFDIIHHGHIKSIMSAAEYGNKLVIGVNADASVRALKGDSRPINNELDRALVLASLNYVDHVVIFNEDNPIELIKALKPDYIVKGGDYTPETVVGNDFIQTYGGQTIIVPLEDGYSTTNIINKMK